MGDADRKLTTAEKPFCADYARSTNPSATWSRQDKFGHVSIQVGKKTLAMLGEHDGVPSLGLKSDLTTQSLLVERVSSTEHHMSASMAGSRSTGR
jgi:hypothetical protein